MLAYGLQPTAVRKKGFNAISQPTTWEQGGIIDVEEDVDKAFKFLEFPRIPAEAFAMVGASQAAAQETSGANQQTTLGSGAPGVRTTGMRSGTGAALVGQAAASRLDGPVERFIRQVFIPWIYKMDELNNEKLPTAILNKVWSEQIGQNFKVDHIEFRNAKMEYEVLAGAHLAAKREMAQFMAFTTTLMANPSFIQNLNEAGWNFNGLAIFRTMADLAGSKYTQDFLIPMSQQQKQLHAMNTPAGQAQVKARAAQQQETQKFLQQQQLLDQDTIGKGANIAMRALVEHTLEPEEIANEGLGAETAA
jgi:hypothetical protein